VITQSKDRALFFLTCRMEREIGEGSQGEWDGGGEEREEPERTKTNLKTDLQICKPYTYNEGMEANQTLVLTLLPKVPNLYL